MAKPNLKKIERDAYQNALNERFQLGKRYAEQSRENAMDLAQSISPGGSMTALNKGDVASFDKKTRRNAEIQAAQAIDYYRGTGMYNTPEYAYNKGLAHMSESAYLTNEAKRLAEQLIESEKKDAEWENGGRQGWYDFTTRQSSIKNKLAEMDAQGRNYYDLDALEEADLLWFDSVVNGNERWKPNYSNAADVERYNALVDQWASVDDWENFDLAKHLGITAPEQYVSKTSTIQGNLNTVSGELERRQGLDALKADIRSNPNYATLSVYGGHEHVEGTLADRYDFDHYYDQQYFMNNPVLPEGFSSRTSQDLIDHYIQFGYDYLTPEELADYNALINARRPEDAKKYLDLLSSELLARRGNVLNAEREVRAEHLGYGALDSAKTLIENPIGSAMTIAGGLFGIDDPNHPIYDTTRGVNTTREVYGQTLGELAPSAKLFDQNLLTMGYNVLMSVGDMAVAKGIGGGLAKAAGKGTNFAKNAMQFVMSSESAASTIMNDLERGWDIEQSMLHGLTNGLIEAWTERGFMDSLFNEGGTFLSRVLKSGMAEGLEEVESGSLQIVTDALFAKMGENESEVEEVYNAFAQTMTQGEAAKMTLMYYANQLAADGLSGFATGGLMQAGTNVAENTWSTNVGKQVQNEGDLEGVLRIAEANEETTEAAGAAKRIREKQAKGLKVTARDMGELVTAVGNTIGEKNAAEITVVLDESITGRLEELGEDAENAKKLAPVIRNMYQGKKITSAERAGVEWTENAEQVVKEMASTPKESAEVVPGAIEGAENQRTGKKWLTEAGGKIQAAQREGLMESMRFNEALTKKTSTTTDVAKAKEKARNTIKGKPKMAARDFAYDTGAAAGSGTFERVRKENGRFKVVMKAEDGKTVEADVDSIRNAGDEGLLTILDYAADGARHDMSEAEVNLLAATYAEQGGDVDATIQQFEDSYLAGYSGIANMTSGMDPQLASIAYEQGRAEAAKDEAQRIEEAKRIRANANPVTGWIGEVTSDDDVHGIGDAKALDGEYQNMTDGEQMVVDLGKELSRNTGLNVVYYRSKANAAGKYTTMNGSYDVRSHTIYLDVNAGNMSAADTARQRESGTLGYAIMRTMGHEVTHAIETTSTEFYAKYKQTVKTELAGKGQDWAQLVRKKLDNAVAGGQKMTYAEAEAEVVADASEYMLQDSKFVSDLDAGLKGKVKRVIQDFMKKVRAAFRQIISGGHEEARALLDGMGHYSKRLQDLWDAGFMEMAGKEVQAVHTGEDTSMVKKSQRDGLYDYSKPFAKQVEDWINGKIPEQDTLLLGRTPEVLQKIGYSDLPMTIDQKHMRYMLGTPKNKDHDLGEDIVKRLPELVADPVAIITNPAPTKGNRAPGVMIIFAEENKNADGRRIVGAVSVLENGKINGVTIDSTRLETAHSRGDVGKKIADAVQKEQSGSHGVYYINKDALSLLEPNQSQVLGTLGHYGVIHSIRDSEEFVNSKFMGQTDSVQFKRWFSGSKIVNDDGTPKIMYHGTPYGGFEEFKDWQYFTENKAYADQYHNPSASSIRGRYNPATQPMTYEVYLSVKKPFDTRNPEIRKIWREEFYGNYSGTPLTEKGLPDWTDGIDLIDFIEENGYDYDGIILDEGAVGGYGDEVQSRGVSVVVRDSTQVKSATDNVGTFDPQNRNIKYSRRDTEYMNAVENGDMEQAQKLVDEAAEEALKESKLRTENGKLRKVYHGTNSTDFNVFDPDYIGASSGDDGFFGRGFYFAYTAGEASYYGRKRIITAYLDMKNPFDFQTELGMYKGNMASTGYAPDAVRILNLAEKFPEIAKKIRMTVEYPEDDGDKKITAIEFAEAYKNVIENHVFEYQDAKDDWGNKETLVLADPEYHEYEYKGEIRRFKDYGFQKRFYGDANPLDVAYEYLVSKVYSYIDMPRFTRLILDNNREFTQELKDRGYDGVIQSKDGDEAVVFESSQIKSADPLTYDDEGNVIPLSERFNSTSLDIRYSRREEQPDSVSIREYLGSMKPTERMTETEKLLLKRYQENLKTLEEKEKLVSEQEAILAAGATGEEKMKAINRRNIYRNQANRASKALLDAERSDGFARVMATSQEVVNRYLLGSAGTVADAADLLDSEIAGLNNQLKAVEADISKAAAGQRAAFARGLFDQKQLNAAATTLKNSYGSRMSAKSIADRLALAYGELYADSSADGAKRFASAARDLAEDILRRSKFRYKFDVLDLLANEVGVISLTETDEQEIRNAGMTLSQYKKAIAPYIKVADSGSDLASYASNAEYFGQGALASILGDDTEGNLAMRLYEIISREKAMESEVAYEGMSEGQLIAETMADIAATNLPMSTNNKTIEYLRKEMLTYAGESAEAAKRIETAMTKAKVASARASNVWRAAVQEVNTAKAAVEYYRKLEEQRRLTELKEQKQEITDQLKSEYAKKLEEKVQKQREEYREREKKAREYRYSRDELNKIRRRIGRNIKRLNTLRMRETDAKHVPQELQHVADLVMQTFTDSSLSRLAFSAEKTASLARRYRLLQEVQSDETYYWDDEIETEIENLQALSEAYTAIRERSAGVPSYFSLEGVQLENEILQGVDNIVSNVLQMIDGRNDAFLRSRNETFEAFATKTGEEILAKDDYKLLKGVWGKWQTAADDMLRTGNMTPIYFMEHLNSPMVKAVFDEVREGQSYYAKIIAEGKDFVQNAKDKYHYGAWAEDGKLKMKTGQGHVIELTREEAAEIYAIAKREKNNKLYQTEHLLYGGFQYKHLENKVGEDGKTVVKNTPNQLDAADIDKISRWLTDEQKAYADELVGFLSSTMANYGNQASMNMFGYKKFTESYYIPFHTAAEQRFQRGDEGPQGENAGTGRVKNSGFTKKLQNGANATLMVGGLTETVSEHIHKMATYAAMVEPIENMKRLMNHKVVEADGTTNTIRALIGQKYGQASQNYMTQLLKDLNGAAQGDERATDLVNKMIGAFKRGAVMASASVVLQQPTAMARAMAMISPRYFAQNPLYRPSKGTWDEMMKYAGTAVIKDMGKFDVGMGLTASQYIADEHLTVMEAYSRMKNEGKWQAGKAGYKRFMDWLTAAPGKADQWTWGLIWKAVKAEQAAKNPGMDVNSEEFLQMCGERFDDVIDHTQVYDSVITRSNLMRSKNAFHKMATSFMSEPTLSINMLYDAVTGEHSGKKRAMIIGSVMASQVLAGALAALAQAWNDDNDKRNWLERYVDKASGNILDNINPLSMIPYVSDLMSMFEGYEVERPDMAAIGDLLNYGMNFIKKAADPEVKLGWKDYENFVGTMANMLGLPAKNISREMRRTRNLIVNSRWTTPDAFNVGQIVLENTPFYEDKNAAYFERIVAAELRGDTKKAEDYREYMLLSKMVNEESLQKGLKKAMQEEFIAGNADEDMAIDYLMKIGAYTEETDAYWEVDKWEYMRETGDKAENYRKYADFLTAVETGTNLKATIQEYLNNGVSKTTLASQISTNFRKKYVTLKKSGKGYADLQARLLTAYEALGYDRAKKLKEIQKWMEKTE